MNQTRLALALAIIAIGCAVGIFLVGKDNSNRSDNNGCVIKSVLNLGAYRSYTTLLKPVKGTSKQQLDQTRSAIPYEITLSSELEPSSKSCIHKQGVRYFAPQLKVVKVKGKPSLKLIK